MTEVLIKDGVEHRVDSTVQITEPEKELKHAFIDAAHFPTHRVDEVNLKKICEWCKDFAMTLRHTYGKKWSPTKKEETSHNQNDENKSFFSSWSAQSF